MAETLDYASPAPKPVRQERYRLPVAILIFINTLLGFVFLVVGVFSLAEDTWIASVMMANGLMLLIATLGCMSRPVPHLGWALLTIAAAIVCDAYMIHEGIAFVEDLKANEPSLAYGDPRRWSNLSYKGVSVNLGFFSRDGGMAAAPFELTLAGYVLTRILRREAIPTPPPPST